MRYARKCVLSGIGDSVLRRFAWWLSPLKFSCATCRWNPCTRCMHTRTATIFTEPSTPLRISTLSLSSFSHLLPVSSLPLYFYFPFFFFFFFFSGINFEILRGWNINQCESTRSRNSLQSGRRIDRFWRVVYRIRGWNTRRCVYTHTRNLDGIRNRLREPLKMPSRWRWMAPRVANIYPVQSSLVHSWREYKEMASNGLKSDIQIATIPENDSMELEIFSILVSFSIFVLRSFFSSSFLVSFSLSTLLLRWFDEFEIYIMMSFS